MLHAGGHTSGNPLKSVTNSSAINTAHAGFVSPENRKIGISARTVQMPPKKRTTPKVELRELIRKHRIRFRGPVPSGHWPDEYKHHFQTIRQIDTIRYEEYISDQKKPKWHREDLKRRVNYLRKRSYHLLDDVKVNEATWRELEVEILKRFDEDVIW